jgi:hypothetical protein
MDEDMCGIFQGAGRMQFSRRGAVILLGGFGLVSIAALAAVPPITQDPHYHAFADARPLFGIPYFWNVVSNLPFAAVGAAGLVMFRREATTAALFLAILLRPSARLTITLRRTTARCSGTGCR